MGGKFKWCKILLSLWISRFSMHKVLLKFTHISYSLSTKKYLWRNNISRINHKFLAKNAYFQFRSQSYTTHLCYNYETFFVYYPATNVVYWHWVYPMPFHLQIILGNSIFFFNVHKIWYTNVTFDKIDLFKKVRL